jgi:hypothetical protein
MALFLQEELGMLCVPIGPPEKSLFCRRSMNNDDVDKYNLSAVCRLPSAVCCLLSAVCCLLSAVCCLQWAQHE